jgi:hypothetical protein
MPRITIPDIAALTEAIARKEIATEAPEWKEFCAIYYDGLRECWNICSDGMESQYIKYRSMGAGPYWHALEERVKKAVGAAAALFADRPLWKIRPLPLPICLSAGSVVLRYSHPTDASTVVILRDGRLRELRRGELTGSALRAAGQRHWENIVAWKSDMPAGGEFCPTSQALLERIPAGGAFCAISLALRERQRERERERELSMTFPPMMMVS